MNPASYIEIAGRTVGPSHPALVIAEVGQAHDGSLGTAHAYIDAAARAGADAIKFQTHIAAAESTLSETFRVKVFPQDATRYDYWKRMEFTAEQWAGLAQHARDRGLVFLSTPFSFEAVDLLERLDVPAWKIGSGDVHTLPLIEKVAFTGKPVLLSSGMSTWAELDESVECIRARGAPFAIFQCTTSYPCPPEAVGLNVIGELRSRYGCAVGLSDHSGTIYASCAAAALGVNLIEVHVVFSRECFGPDVTSSITIGELSRLVAGVRFIETAIESKVDKDHEAAERANLRQLFGRSLAATRDLQPGHCLAPGDLALKKPGVGIAANRLSEVLGRRLTRGLQANEFLQEDHLV